MVDVASMRNKKFSEFAERQPHQPGWYRGRFVSANGRDVASVNGGFVSYSFAYKAEEPLSGQDMKGVNTNRQIYKEIPIFSEDDEANLSEWIKRMNPDFAPSALKGNGKSDLGLEEIIESLVNTEVLVEVGEDRRFRKDKGEYRPAVIGVKVQA